MNKGNKDNKRKGYKKESLFDFSSYLNQTVTVDFNGGRQITGIIKSYDAISNLVLDNVIETVNKEYKRHLGIVFIKGTNITNVIPGKIDEIDIK